MNEVLLLETRGLRHGLQLLNEVTGRVSRSQVDDIIVPLTIRNSTPGEGDLPDGARAITGDLATPNDAEGTLRLLIARGAALRVESAAVIEQAHTVQAQSRLLRVQSAVLVHSGSSR
ncbi:hypothetical protein JL101_034660 (plasmid) [Skermanella rosea]|uniref:hypothetical protein n=1 Tax=Skermanella rosea TaxID=1817965 RepID=UPI0019316313|nr:hypothetical protein [Skermanella rosea]UEM07719.1 hypothetical protein JL101_034660 [Skermanella rosea]